VDDVTGADPELGWPDGGDVWLLPGSDVGDSLGADGPALLGGVDGCELAVGLVESPGLPDAGEPDVIESDVAECDVAEPEVGLVLDGASTLPDIGDVEGGPLLGPADDGADWLGTLDNTALGSDDAAGLADGGEPEVGLVLDGGSMLPDVGDVELGGASLDAGEGPLLGAADEGADWLGTLDSTGLVSEDTPGLAEPPELADGGDVDCRLPLDGSPSLEVGLPDSVDIELAVGLDPADGTLLSAIDDIAETLSTLAELATDDCDGGLCETIELPDWPSLLLSLIESTELVGEPLSLATLWLLPSLLGSDDFGLATDDSPDGNDDFVLNDDGWLATLDVVLDGADEIGEPGDEDSADGRLEASLGVDDALGWDDGLWKLEEPVESLDLPCEDCESLDALIDEPDGLESPDDLDGELPELRDPSLSDERLSDDRDDSGDEPLLFDFEEGEEERADGAEAELRDSDDPLCDEPEELRRELLRSELLWELLEELSDEPLERDRLLDDGIDDTGLLDSELRRLLLGLLFEELSTELLSDESLDELGDDRDDSLTLENDLLDPKTTDEELIRCLPDTRYG
jgi:hypothetical protein